MNEITAADILAFIGIVILAVANAVQFKLNSDNRDADTIEKLTASIDTLYSRQDELQSQLDEERVARRIAEAKLSDLTRRFVILEADNKRLASENSDLISELGRFANDC